MKRERSFCSADRYVFDFDICSARNGWSQIDSGQDAWYYGQWGNPTTLQLMSYTEGDICKTTCENKKEFAEEVRALDAWHKEYEEKGIKIDALCDPGMVDAWKALGLGDLLH